MHRGYLALWRKLSDHPFWKEEREFSKAEAWIDILWEVQHSEKPQEVLLGMTCLICNYGESLKSLETWSKRWNWNKSRVRRFLKLLENMNQIRHTSEQKTTRITVLKYSQYDPRRNATETQLKRQRNDSETQATPDKNVKNVKNVKNGKKTKDIVFNPHSIRPEWIEEKDWSDIILHRKKHKNKPPETERAFNGIINQLEKATKQGFSLKECVDQMCSRGWQSFNVDWMPAKNGIMQPRTKKEVHDETRERFARELLEAGDTGYKPDYRRNEELDHKI